MARQFGNVKQSKIRNHTSMIHISITILSFLAGLEILIQIIVAACWLVTYSARRSSHPPPDARAHALHILHLHRHGRRPGAPDQRRFEQQSRSAIHRAGAEFGSMRRTDPTPAASTPAATAVAPAPTKREAMLNALNGIANAVPPFPRRNHATPTATCPALAAAHHGHLSASAPLPPPSRSSIPAATRVFGGQLREWQPYTSAECHRQVGPGWKYPPASPLTCGTGHHRSACVGKSR